MASPKLPLISCKNFALESKAVAGSTIVLQLQNYKIKITKLQNLYNKNP
jgi:hypothetical protein